jgi:REP element-mobilizing transposase RayT
MRLLQSERMAELFCNMLLEKRATNKFLLHAFIVMPNHIHLLITVPPGSTLERTMQLIKGGFSREAGKLLSLAHPFWQKSLSIGGCGTQVSLRGFANTFTKTRLSRICVTHRTNIHIPPRARSLHQILYLSG